MVNSTSSERKKMTNVYILEILRKYTDDTYDKEGNPAHCLTQAQIAEKLFADYNIILDRKAVSRGLADLTASPEFHDKIEYDIEVRKAKIDGVMQDSEIRTNYRYRHDFDTAQIRLLIDAVLFSRNIPTNESKDLLEQISKLGGVDSRSHLSKHIYRLSVVSGDRVANDELLNNIDIIDEAIEKGRKISFIYNHYGKDKKLHPRLGSDGKAKIRTVSPYLIQASNGRYYLVCNYDEYDNVVNVRVDKITNIEILDEPEKPKKEVSGLKNSPVTLAEMLYMQPGNPERIIFKATNSENIISELIDWFGKSIRFVGEDESTVTCEVKAVPGAMKFWAMQYSDHVEIIEPESLRDTIRESLCSAKIKYNGKTK